MKEYANNYNSTFVVVIAGSNLRWSICLEFFSDPRVLPCLHTYFLKCLQALLNDQKIDLNYPQCRVKHEIPKGGVVSYLCNLSILPDLEVAKITTKKKETKICDLCITSEVAVDSVTNVASICANIVIIFTSMETDHLLIHKSSRRGCFVSLLNSCSFN